MDQVSPQGCRAIISRFYEALNARDVDGVLACYHPAAMIEVVAPSPFGGEFPPSETPLTQLFSIFPELVFEIDGFVTEDDRVAVEVHSTGKMRDGSPYKNRYHNFFEIKDGLVFRFREYPTATPGA
jgi:ketosteroid isomerase-like protein